MALFWLKIDGKRTPCFVDQDQDVENLEDLAITEDNKKEFVAALSSDNFSHNALLELTVKVGMKLPSDARKASKKDLAKNIFNKIVGKPVATISSKKKGKKEESSDDDSTDEEEKKRKKEKKAKKKAAATDELTANFDRLAVEGQSVSSRAIPTSES